MRYIDNIFYGDETRWFIGIVEETNTDEPRLGRVRVRIHGVHDNRDAVPVSDLPYAQVLVPTTEPGTSGLGRAPRLLVGALVFGIFLDGKTSQLPLVLGSIPKIETPSNEQIDNRSNDPALTSVLTENGGDPTAGVRGSDGQSPSIRSSLNRGVDRLDESFRGKVNDPVKRTQIAWEILSRKNTWQHHHIAAILGSLYYETELDPNFQSGNFVGLFRIDKQSVLYSRFLGFARDRETNAFSFASQIDFVDYLLNDEPKFKGSELYKKHTVKTAVQHFQTYFLGTEENFRARADTSLKIYNNFIRRS